MIGGNGGGNINVDEGVDKKQKHDNQLTHSKPIGAVVASLNRGRKGEKRVVMVEAGGSVDSQ